MTTITNPTAPSAQPVGGTHATPARGVIWRLLWLSRPFIWPMALAALLGFATVISNVGLMATSAWIISMAAISDTIAVLGLAVVGVRFFGVSRGVFRYLERLTSHQVTFQLLARFRVWFYERIEPLAPARLSTYRSGDLLSRVVGDIETLQEFYLRVIAPTAVALATVLVMAIFTAIFEPLVTAALMVFYIAAGVGLPWAVARLSHAVGPDVVETRSALNAAAIDGVQGMADLVAYGAQARQREAINHLSAGLETHQLRMARADAVQAAGGVLLASGAMLAALIIAAPRVDGLLLGTMALSALASFEAILPLSVAVRHLSENVEAGRRLFQIVDDEPTVDEPPTPRALPTRFDVVFDDVTFRYGPGEPDALRGVTLRIAENEHVAVVGPSGSGKSTLVNLLLRFWDTTEGAVCIGGVDVRTLRQDDLRELVGVVAQKTHLFNTSVRENLLIARPDATDEEVEAAARTAQIHDFIEGLPQGYDTVIGEQGQKLSGGERQRVAIARALLKDAPILVLDEPTANLDAVTERALLRDIERAMQGRTVLIITHRPAALESVDRVVSLRDGRIGG